MFLLLFLMYFSFDLSQSQMMYNRMIPNDPRYFLQRPPVRRSAMEALERLRVPIARYYPQSDVALPSGPYQAPAVPFPNYPSLNMDELYARAPQWSDDFGQQVPETPEEGDYGNYDYENLEPAYRPAVYVDDAYAQEPVAEVSLPESPDSNLYNDFMLNYLYNNPAAASAPQQEQFDLQRRSDMPSMPSTSNTEQGVIALSNVLQANKNLSSSTSNVESPTMGTSPAPSSAPVKVQMTAVPSSPAKKEIKSLVIPEPVAMPSQEQDNIWRELGQKEEPLFRPMQSSQRTTWEVLNRAKNSAQKRPIPFLKKMIQNVEQKKAYDPLTEELKNLKKEMHV